jgi:glycerol uptake facilitator-like aquaporin
MSPHKASNTFYNSASLNPARDLGHVSLTVEALGTVGFTDFLPIYWTYFFGGPIGAFTDKVLMS